MPQITIEATDLLMGEHMFYLVATGLLLAIGLVAGFLALRLARLTHRLGVLLKDNNGENLEDLLIAQEKQIATLSRQLQVLQAQTAQLARQMVDCFRHMGLVRFSAFPDTGGDQSFSLAILDSQRNGVVITSIHGREEARTYGKPVQNGKSSYYLTKEESEAILQAITPKISSEKVSSLAGNPLGREN